MVAARSSVLVNSLPAASLLAASSGVFSAGSEEHREVSARRVYLSCRLPTNVIVVNRGPAPFARHCVSLPIGRDYQSADRSDRGPSGVSLRVFIVRKERDRNAATRSVLGKDLVKTLRTSDLHLHPAVGFTMFPR